MRARNFSLTEASIFGNPERYKYGHKVLLATGQKAGKAEKVADYIAKTLPDFDADEELTWVSRPKKSSDIKVIVPFGKEDNYRFFQRNSGETIALKGSDSGIQAILRHGKEEKASVRANVGDLSEPVLSAAVVAKLIKRGKDAIGNINENDVINVLNSAIKDPTLTFNVYDKDSKVADVINFTVAVRQPTMEFMRTSEFWEKYKPLLPSVVHYANGGEIDRYADYFYKNGKVDKVIVKSDGVTDQKGKKTDVEAYVTDENGNDRPLKGLKISLKAGSKQFGQFGAGSLKGTSESPKHAFQVANNFFATLGVNLTPPTGNFQGKADYWEAMYQQAAKQLKVALAGNNAKKEAGVVNQIATAILHHATKGDEKVKLIQLSKTGVSSIHNFSGIIQKMLSDRIDLTVSYRVGTSKNGLPLPEISIYDKNSNNPLVKIGYHSTGDQKKIWNAITMEKLLSELTHHVPVKRTFAQTPDQPTTEPKLKSPIKQPPADKPQL
jgi:hypothetical protein